jgi:hypothetical protein
LLNHYHHYREKGWVHIENFLIPRDVSGLRYHGGQVAGLIRDTKDLGSPCVYGSLTHWNGVGCASMYDKVLWGLYTAPFMYDLATTLLETDEPYLFNDQLVWKYRDDEFGFQWHTDNSTAFRDNPIQDHTVNCLIFAHDVTEGNGGLTIMNKDNHKEVTIFPKAGDVVCIDGNTYHASGVNTSGSVRGAYACVYADNMVERDRYYITRFYDERKESETNEESWDFEKERQEKLSVNESPE